MITQYIPFPQSSAYQLQSWRGRQHKHSNFAYNNSSNKQAQLNFASSHHHYAWEMCSWQSAVPAQHNEYASFPTGLHCIIKSYPASMCKCFKPLTSQSCFLLTGSTASVYCCIVNNYYTWCYTEYPDLYCCDYMVNWSSLVNILHYSFAKWPRLQREETIAPCWSGWHKTPPRPSSLGVKFDDESMTITHF